MTKIGTNSDSPFDIAKNILLEITSIKENLLTIDDTKFTQKITFPLNRFCLVAEFDKNDNTIGIYIARNSTSFNSRHYSVPIEVAAEMIEYPALANLKKCSNILEQVHEYGNFIPLVFDNIINNEDYLSNLEYYHEGFKLGYTYSFM